MHTHRDQLTMDRRLIEAGFPCHQVGAETQREQSVGLQPPVNRLHVWWARRPLTASRAPILYSLLPAGTDPETFIRRLGIERVQALVHGEPWALTGKLLERIELRAGRQVLPLDTVVQRAYLAEQQTRGLNRDLVASLKAQRPDLAADPVLRRWEQESRALPELPMEDGGSLATVMSMADPAWANEKMAFTAANAMSFPGDAYGYARAFGNVVPYAPSSLVLLDPTAGGGSIPFEALRLGHRVIANDLNPVASAILHAAIDFPARFGTQLLVEIGSRGRRLLREVDEVNLGLYADGQPLPSAERKDLERLLGPGNQGIIGQFDCEHIQDYLYARQVTCPHCGGTLADLYPGQFVRRLTDKKSEAVANRARDGSGEAAKDAYEQMMQGIFRECLRVLKDDGLFTLMFNHKSQDAWETLTRSLIDAGWVITACFPVESEGENSTHQKDLAAAASSIFLSCRKRPAQGTEAAIWESAFGQTGIRRQIEAAVRQGLTDFAPLRLNPVDEMVASYGKALQVLSAHWPVQDGDDLVSPVKAMNEASRVVSQGRVSQITKGKVRVVDLDSETAMALTIFGIWELSEVAYDDILNLSRSLGIALAAKPGGYLVQDREIGINQSAGTRGRSPIATGGADGYQAPLIRSGSKLRLALPEERHGARLTDPQTDWDRLQGLIAAYREGDIPVARAYLQEHAAERAERILELLEVWAAQARSPDLKRQARMALFGLRRG